jgi:hypothetical protein
MKQTQIMPKDEIKTFVMKIIKTSEWKDRDGKDQRTYVLGYKGRVFILSTLDFKQSDFIVKSKSLVLQCDIKYKVKEYINKEGFKKKGYHLKKAIDQSDLVINALNLENSNINTKDSDTIVIGNGKFPISMNTIIENESFNYECFDTIKGPVVKITSEEFYFAKVFWMSHSLRKYSGILSVEELDSAIEQSPNSFVLNVFGDGEKKHYRIYKRKIKNIIKNK